MPVTLGPPRASFHGTTGPIRAGEFGYRPTAARPGRRGLDVERELTPGGETGETPVGAVGDDGPHVGQFGQPVGEQLASGHHVVGPGRVDPHRERQAQDLDEDAALGAHRPATPPAGGMERGTGPSATHGPGVEHHHRRLGAAALVGPDRPGEPAHHEGASRGNVVGMPEWTPGGDPICHS